MAVSFARSDAPASLDVVYVIASMITGGTQTHLLQVFQGLDRARYRPHLYCLRDEGNLIDAARELDVPVLTFGMRGSWTRPGDVGGLRRIVRALRELRPAVVHGYLLRGNFFGSVAARAAGVPVIVTSKRGHHAPSSLAERAAVKVSNALSATVTGNSPAVLEFTREVEGRFRAPMQMIPSGIDTERFDPAVDDGLRSELGLGEVPVVGCAITWRPRKGFRLLFEAFARVREALPDARLVIAGEDALSGDPAALASELGIEHAVVTLGRRSDMPRVLASLDVFVQPSESEGMSNALLEAMAMELPVVATAVGGNPYVIEDGVSGFLVDYPDSTAMAARLVELLGDPGRRWAVGNAARGRIVERYSTASMVCEMADMYDRLLRESAR